VIWDAFASPAARAYEALKDLDLGTELAGDRVGDPSLEFNSGGNPCSSEQWVEATDLRAVSLLQARLVELGRPYRLISGELT
jgi:hypothetical protein